MEGEVSPMGGQVKPWHRQDGESEEAFEAFNIYRLMGVDRSLEKVAEHLKKHPKTIRRHSAKYNWISRCTIWDNELAVIDDKIVLDARKQIQEEHLKAWRMVRHLAMVTINRYAKKAQDNPEEIPTSLKDAITALKESTTFERLVTGEATSRQETRTMDVSALEPKEAEELLKLLEKVDNAEAN